MNKIIGVQNYEKPSKLRIEYMIGNTCNYSCWYCPETSHAGTHKYFHDYNTLLKNFNHLLDYYKKNGKKEFEINFVGGEPTLWPDIAKFSKTLKENYNCHISISTNASRTLRWWEENYSAFDKIKLSCHALEVNIDHYISVADLLYSKGSYINALIMMDPKNWDKCLAIVDKCKTSKYPWFISAMEIFSDQPYSTEQQAYIKNHIKRRPSLWWILKKEKRLFNRKPSVIFETGYMAKVDRNWITLNDLNTFKGWSCNLGIDSINIQYDGKISGTCNMKLYGENQYYNLYDQDFVNKFNPELRSVICEIEKCYCQPEVLLDKRKFSDRVVIPLLAEYPTNKYTIF